MGKISDQSSQIIIMDIILSPHYFPLPIDIPAVPQAIFRNNSSTACGTVLQVWWTAPPPSSNSPFCSSSSSSWCSCLWQHILRLLLPSIAHQRSLQATSSLPLPHQGYPAERRTYAAESHYGCTRLKEMLHCCQASGNYWLQNVTEWTWGMGLAWM